MKKALDDEVFSLKDKVSELEKKYVLKCEEILSLTEVKDREISALFAETSDLRMEIAQKVYAVIFAYFIVYSSYPFSINAHIVYPISF